MVSRDFCKSETRKLLGKPFTPAEDVTIGVVIDALANYSQSEAHVKRIVAKVLHELPRWPDVTDIRQIALETRGAELRPSATCEQCEGSGFKKPIMRGGYEYSGGRCDCWSMVRAAGGGA